MEKGRRQREKKKVSRKRERGQTHVHGTYMLRSPRKRKHRSEEVRLSYHFAQRTRRKERGMFIIMVWSLFLFLMQCM